MCVSTAMSQIMKITVPEKERLRLYMNVSVLCLSYAVATGSVSPLSQAVLPVQLGRFLLPGGIRLRRTFKAG